MLFLQYTGLTLNFPCQEELWSQRQEQLPWVHYSQLHRFLSYPAWAFPLHCGALIDSPVLHIEVTLLIWALVTYLFHLMQYPKFHRHATDLQHHIDTLFWESITQKVWSFCFLWKQHECFGYFQIISFSSDVTFTVLTSQLSVLWKDLMPRPKFPVCSLSHLLKIVFSRCSHSLSAFFFLLKLQK